MTKRRLALIGDHDPRVTAHAAISKALALASAQAGDILEWQWMGTETIRDASSALEGYSGVWVVPASPYRNTDGVLSVIRHVREHDIPFLGTCGGFQHAVLEYARNVAGIGGADHAENNPAGADLIFTPLACALVEETGAITFTPGSRLAAIFGGGPTVEGYHCRYGLNPAYRSRLEAAGLRFTGFDSEGDVRAAELPGRRFFVGTLFQPERSGLRGQPHPLISAFVAAIDGTVSSKPMLR